MKRTPSTIFSLLLIAIMLIALSCSKPRENTGISSPLPNANSPVPTLGATALGEIKGETGKPQTVDIISGKPIDKSVYTDINGERLYFCCGQSKSDFQKNFKGYLAKIKERGIILESTPSQ